MTLYVLEFKFKHDMPHQRRDEILAISPYAFVGPHGVDPVTLREPLDSDYYHAFITEKEARDYMEQLRTYPEVDGPSIWYQVFVPSGDQQA